MSTPNEIITLKTKFSNGTGGEAELFHFAGKQVDAEGVPLASPPPLTATSNQSSYVGAFTHTTDASVAEGDVDIRAVGKAPLGLSQAIVTVSDGRAVNGTPVTYTIQVNIGQNPDLSAIQAPTKDAVRAL